MRDQLRGALSLLTGRDVVFRALMRDDVTIFLFHDVSDQPSRFSAEYNLNVRPETFAEQVRLIADDYNIIGPDELRGGNYKSPAAMITFDDGFPGYFENAVPILKAAGFPSLIFLNMAPILGDVFWSGLATYLCDEIPEFRPYLAMRVGRSELTNPYLYCTPQIVSEFLEGRDRDAIFAEARSFYGRFADESHLRCAAADDVGFVFFGSHLFNHFNAASLRLSELEENYLANERHLAKYPNYVNFFSYPFGQPGTCYNRATDEVIDQCGASFVFSAYPLPNRQRGRRWLNRISLDGGTASRNRFRLEVLFTPWVNAIFRRPEHSYR